MDSEVTKPSIDLKVFESQQTTQQAAQGTLRMIQLNKHSPRRSVRKHGDKTTATRQH